MADNVTNSSIISTQNNSHVNTEHIYVHSKVQKLCYTSVILIFCLWIYASNSTLIAVLLKFRVTTKSNRTIRIILALTDMSICSLVFCVTVPILFKGDLFNLQFCSILTDTGHATIYFSIMVTATLAVERYIYLSKPLKYHLLKPKHLAGFLLTCFTFILLYFLIYGQVQGHQYQFADFFCPAKRPSKLHLALRACILFVLPAIIITFILVKTKQLHSSQLVQQQLAKSTVKKSVKLILMVSGLFFITTVPLYIICMSIVEISEKGTHIVIIIRILTIVLLLLSSALNPLIHLFVENDLFVGVLTLLGKNADFSWQKEMKRVVNIRKMQSNATSDKICSNNAGVPVEPTLRL